jgi:hypothetical protein
MNRTKLIFPLEQAIELNLSLQTTSKKLSDLYKIYKPSLNLFKSKRFLDYFSTWDEQKKKDFIVTIGGTKNFKRTKEFLESMIKKEQGL